MDEFAKKGAIAEVVAMQDVKTKFPSALGWVYAGVLLSPLVYQIGKKIVKGVKKIKEKVTKMRKAKMDMRRAKTKMAKKIMEQKNLEEGRIFEVLVDLSSNLNENLLGKKGVVNRYDF